MGGCSRVSNFLGTEEKVEKWGIPRPNRLERDTYDED